MKLKQCFYSAIILMNIGAGDPAFAQKIPSRSVVLTQSGNNSESISTTVHNWAVATSSILTIFGLGFAGQQYFQAEKWKRREYLDKKFQEFENQPETINVRKMLLNEVQLINLFPTAEDPHDRYVLVTIDILTRALTKPDAKELGEKLRTALETAEREKKPCKQEEVLVDAAIRDNFNMFLQYLQHFEVVVQSKTVDRKDLEVHLDPWIKLIKHMSATESCTICKEKVLEYMGLHVGVSDSQLSPVQRRIRKLFTKDCAKKLAEYQVQPGVVQLIRAATRPENRAA